MPRANATPVVTGLWLATLLDTCFAHTGCGMIKVQSQHKQFNIIADLYQFVTRDRYTVCSREMRFRTNYG